MFCNKCNNEIPKEARFCNNCGVKVEAEHPNEQFQSAQEASGSAYQPQQSPEPADSENQTPGSPAKQKKKPLFILLPIIAVVCIIALLFTLSNDGESDRPVILQSPMQNTDDDIISDNVSQSTYVSDEEFSIAADRIAANSEASFFIMPDDSLWAWGTNRFGTLGIGSRTETPFGEPGDIGPYKVMEGVRAVVATYTQVLAIRHDGSLWAWGQDARHLGNYSHAYRIPVYIMSDVISVATGWRHAVAIRSDGSLWGQGLNHRGQLGDGTTEDRHEPVRIMDSVISIAAGYFSSLAVRRDGTLWSWGSNEAGELGDGSTTHGLSPTRILDDVVAASTTGVLAFAIKE